MLPLTAPAAASRLAGVSLDHGVAALRLVLNEQPEHGVTLASALLTLGGNIQVMTAAAEALGWGQSPDAADVAAGWSLDDQPRDVRKAARRALLRLAQRGIKPSGPLTLPDDPTDIPAQRPREQIRRGVSSSVDREGARAMYLLVDPTTGGLQMVFAVVSNSAGVVQFDAIPSSPRAFERFLVDRMKDQLDPPAFPVAEISPVYARYLLERATAVARDRSLGVPPRFATFRDSLGLGRLSAGSDGKPLLEAPPHPVYDLPEAAGVRLRPDQAEDAIYLLERPEFSNWLPGPEEVMRLAEEWQNAERGLIALPPAAVAARRQTTFDRLAEAVLGPGGAADFRQRLEDNALVMIRTGAPREGRDALALAMSIDPEDRKGTLGHPFVRAITQRLLDVATDALARGQPTSIADAAPVAAASGDSSPSRLLTGSLVRSGEAPDSLAPDASPPRLIIPWMPGSRSTPQ